MLLIILSLINCSQLRWKSRYGRPWRQLFGTFSRRSPPRIGSRGAQRASSGKTQQVCSVCTAVASQMLVPMQTTSVRHIQPTHCPDTREIHRRWSRPLGWTGLEAVVPIAKYRGCKGHWSTWRVRPGVQVTARTIHSASNPNRASRALNSSRSTRDGAVVAAAVCIHVRNREFGFLCVLWLCFTLLFN